MSHASMWQVMSAVEAGQLASEAVIGADWLLARGRIDERQRAAFSLAADELEHYLAPPVLVRQLVHAAPQIPDELLRAAEQRHPDIPLRWLLADLRAGDTVGEPGLQRIMRFFGAVSDAALAHAAAHRRS